MRRTAQGPFAALNLRHAFQGLMELPWSAPPFLPAPVPARRGR